MVGQKLSPSGEQTDAALTRDVKRRLRSKLVLSQDARCSERVMHGWHSLQCAITYGLREREGKIFCAMHDPQLVALRRDAREISLRCEISADAIVHLIKVAESTLATCIIQLPCGLFQKMPVRVRRLARDIKHNRDRLYTLREEIQRAKEKTHA